MMKNKDSMSRPAPAETGAAAVSGEPHTEAGAGDGMEAPVLLPCPFCGGEASDAGYVRYSRPLEDTTWEDGSPITEAFFCNCIKCGVSNMVSSIGYRTKNDAVAAWNTRALATPDHTATLEAVKAKARAEGRKEGMREAARVINTGGLHTIQSRVDAILAEAENEAQ